MSITIPNTNPNTNRLVSGWPSESARLCAFQLGRLAQALEARRQLAEKRAGGSLGFDRASRAQARGVDHIAYGLHRACVELGAKELADELVVCFREGTPPDLDALFARLRRLVPER